MTIEPDMRPVVIPRWVQWMPGCICGGYEWHKIDCPILDVEPDERRRLMDEADQRVRDYARRARQVDS